VQHTTSYRVVGTVVDQTTGVAIHNLTCQAVIEGTIDLASTDNLLREINREVATSTVVGFNLEEELGKEVVASTIVGFNLEVELSKEVVTSTIVGFNPVEELDRVMVASTIVGFNLDYLVGHPAAMDKVDL